MSLLFKLAFFAEQSLECNDAFEGAFFVRQTSPSSDGNGNPDSVKMKMPMDNPHFPNQTAFGSSSSYSFAAIVCAYTQDRWDDIVDVMRSLQSQTLAIDEVILVIDHNDELFAKAKEAFGSQAKVVENVQKQGLSGARNSGIAASTSTIIAFIDDDAVADENWATNMLAAYKDEHVLGVGGTIEPLWLAGRPSWWPEEFDWVVGCTYRGHTDQSTEIRNAIGANMSLRRDAFFAVDGFHNALGRVGTHPVGAEETELYVRIRRAFPNGRVMFAPQCRVQHKVPAIRGTFRYFLRRCYAEGLSKSVVSRIAQRSGNLSSEWSYTLKTLPLGVIRNMLSVRRKNTHGLAKAGAILAGLFTTTAGYLYGRLATVELRDPTLKGKPE